MDQFKNSATALQQPTAATNGLSTNTTTSLVSESDRRKLEKNYREAVLLVVHDSFEASSHNSTLAEEIARADVWTRLLFGLVPVDRLQQCFDRAFRDKSDTFPVNAYEVKNAWTKIQADEAARAAEAAADAAAERSKVEKCQNKPMHEVVDGVDEGLVEFVYGGVNGKSKLMPCPYCRPEGFRQASAREIEYGEQDMSPDAQSAVALVIASKEKPKIAIPVNPTAAEYLQIFYELIKPEYEKAVGVEREGLLVAAQMIVHAQGYVRDPARFYQSWLDRQKAMEVTQ
jgi:hypothetical protein